ncbi:hypothetical protein FB547_1246 [Variovorax beijingensis]|uniref:Uncharacterized protein n=1 Tax=Variovorax beijingensis TaxID=2496117 RepID=A0A561B3Q4_9BURK|nr:hypothetical protein FB547_1246 [Variovorax beijingensis]
MISATCGSVSVEKSVRAVLRRSWNRPVLHLVFLVTAKPLHDTGREHQQCAADIKLLEPLVIAVVDLDELADACPTVARLVDLGRALFAGCPQTGRHHQHPDGLLGQWKPMALPTLLACKRWPEISIPIPDQRSGTLGDAWRQLTVAGPTSLARDPPGNTFVLVPLDQTLELPSTQAQPLRGLANPQHPVDHRLNSLEPIGFAHRHSDRRSRCRHGHASELGAANFATFQLCWNATLQLCSHSCSRYKFDYVKGKADSVHRARLVVLVPNRCHALLIILPCGMSSQ